jgi:CheY-like chemotaxis protein
MSDSVLVVEDHPELRHAVKALLESEGYEVHCASSSEEAIDLLGRLHPRMLLWDALTPRHDPALVDQAIQEGVHVATLPVSLSTALVDGPADWNAAKRLTSHEAILSILREHCPIANPANT